MLSASPAVHNALKNYTVWAAHQMCLDNRIGSLETGIAI
jgi:hypothetical protein